MPVDDLTIRRTDRDDIDRLAAICRRSFPHVLRWRLGGDPARSWWQAVMVSESCESWAAIEEETIAGFVVLVTNERGWQAGASQRRTPYAAVIRTLASRPWAVPALLLPAGRFRNHGDPAELPPPARGSSPHERTWIELIAVDPLYRGAGLAQRLLDHTTERTGTLHRSSIQLSVRTSNRSAIRCYAAAGFGTVHQARDGLILGKRLVEAA